MNIIIYSNLGAKINVGFDQYTLSKVVSYDKYIVFGSSKYTPLLMASSRNIFVFPDQKKPLWNYYLIA